MEFRPQLQRLIRMHSYLDHPSPIVAHERLDILAFRHCLYLPKQQRTHIEHLTRNHIGIKNIMHLICLQLQVDNSRQQPFITKSEIR